MGSLSRGWKNYKRLYGVRSGGDGGTGLSRERDQTGGIQMLSDAYTSGQGSDDFISGYLKNVKGSQGEIDKFLKSYGPMIDKLEGSKQAKLLKGSAGMKHMEDQGNWDLGAMSSYGREAAGIGEGARRATDLGQQRMGAMGLGRSSMRAALQANVAQQGVAAQSNSFAAAQQRAATNRMQSAQSLLDAHRMVAQVSMGQQITPRVGGGGGDAGPSQMAGALSGAASGAMAGGAMGGPGGAIAGGILGGAAGWFGGK